MERIEKHKTDNSSNSIKWINGQTKIIGGIYYTIYKERRGVLLERIETTKVTSSINLTTRTINLRYCRYQSEIGYLDSSNQNYKVAARNNYDGQQIMAFIVN